MSTVHRARTLGWGTSCFCCDPCQGLHLRVRRALLPLGPPSLRQPPLCPPLLCLASPSLLRHSTRPPPTLRNWHSGDLKNQRHQPPCQRLAEMPPKWQPVRRIRKGVLPGKDEPETKPLTTSPEASTPSSHSQLSARLRLQELPPQIRREARPSPTPRGLGAIGDSGHSGGWSAAHALG